MNVISFREMDLSYIHNCLKCDDCNGTIAFGTTKCIFCGKEKDSLVQKYEETERILNENLNNDIPFDIENNYNLITLYMAHRDSQSEILTCFVEKQKIEEKIDNFLNEVNDKIKRNEKLTVEENSIYLNLLTNHMIKEEKQHRDILIRSVLLQEPLIDNEVFFGLIQNFTVSALKAYNKGRIPHYEPECTIKKLNANEENDKVRGGFARSYHTICLDADTLQNIYEGSFWELHVLFHEIYHIMDNIDIKTGMFSRDIVRHIQEHIIRFREAEKANKNGENPKYYDENYQLISFEKDANINGYILYTRFLDSLGLYSKEFEEHAEEEIKQELIQKAELLRNVSYIADFESNYASVDEMFLYYAQDHPEYLKKYPQLTIGYTVKDGTISKKTRGELMDNILYTDNTEIAKYTEELLKQDQIGTASVKK